MHSIRLLNAFILNQVRREIQNKLPPLLSLPQLHRLDIYHRESTAAEQERIQSVPNCNIGTIGHIDHGKTTLTSAITKVLAKDGLANYVPYDSIDKTREEKARGITVNASHVGYQTDVRKYAHTDCPGHADYIRNMISGTSQMDCAIVVVAATDGPMPQTKEHLLLAKQIGVQRLVIFVNKADLVDTEVLELVEIEMRELIEFYGFDSVGTPVVYGSAYQALNGIQSEYGEPSIRKLLKILDEYVPTPERDLKSPFLMPIDNVFNIHGRGCIIVGTIKRGIIRKNDPANLMGFGNKLKTTVSEIQIFRKAVEMAEAGENVGILLRGLRMKDIKRGMIICLANSENLSNVFNAEFYLLSPGEGGRTKPIGKSGYIQQMFSATWDVACRIDLRDDREMLLPGDHAPIRLILPLGMLLPIGQSFTVRENNVVVGTGRIVSVLPLIHVQDKADLKKLEYKSEA